MGLAQPVGTTSEREPFFAFFHRKKGPAHTQWHPIAIEVSIQAKYSNSVANPRIRSSRCCGQVGPRDDPPSPSQTHLVPPILDLHNCRSTTSCISKKSGKLQPLTMIAFYNWGPPSPAPSAISACATSFAATGKGAGTHAYNYPQIRSTYGPEHSMWKLFGCTAIKPQPWLFRQERLPKTSKWAHFPACSAAGSIAAATLGLALKTHRPRVVLFIGRATFFKPCAPWTSRRLRKGEQDAGQETDVGYSVGGFWTRFGKLPFGFCIVFSACLFCCLVCVLSNFLGSFLASFPTSISSCSFRTLIMPIFISCCCIHLPPCLFVLIPLVSLNFLAWVDSRMFLSFC